MSIQEQLYTVWLPLGIMALFAVIGSLRGPARETIVAASVALAALINIEWAGQWGEGLSTTVFKNLNQGQIEFVISFAVLWLVVMVIGYGLGYFVPKGPLTPMSRLAGGLLGLANGAAVAGWSLRYAFANLDSAQQSSQFYQNSLSYALMVFAAWFPLLLALMGAVLVLVGPVRRAQSALSQPSKASDWEQAAPQPGPVMGEPQAYDPAAAARYTPALAAAPTVAIAAQDAPPNSVPVRAASDPSIWAPPPSVEQAPASMETRQFETVTPAPAGQGSDAGTGTYDNTSKAAAGDASWLVHPTGTEAPPSEPAAATNEPEKKCPNCGASVAQGAFFCTECGNKVT